MTNEITAFVPYDERVDIVFRVIAECWACGELTNAVDESDAERLEAAGIVLDALPDYNETIDGFTFTHGPGQFVETMLNVRNTGDLDRVDADFRARHGLRWVEEYDADVDESLCGFCRASM